MKGKAGNVQHEERPIGDIIRSLHRLFHSSSFLASQSLRSLPCLLPSAARVIPSVLLSLLRVNEGRRHEANAGTK